MKYSLYMDRFYVQKNQGEFMNLPKIVIEDKVVSLKKKLIFS